MTFSLLTFATSMLRCSHSSPLSAWAHRQVYLNKINSTMAVATAIPEQDSWYGGTRRKLLSPWPPRVPHPAALAPRPVDTLEQAVLRKHVHDLLHVRT